VAIVIAGIIASTAVRYLGAIRTSSKVEETKQKMDALAFAIAGNPAVTNNGARADFGYVGDVGALPANLDALMTNPGSYTTWKGPYVSNRYTQLSDDYKRDAWGNLLTYSGGLTIQSSGGGSTLIRRLANSTSDLLINKISGAICDIDGTPPGPIYKDSLSVKLTYPNGAGAMLTKIVIPDAAGYFSFDSIPTGTQSLWVIYKPYADTISQPISVTPHASAAVASRYSHDYWYATPASSGALQFVSGSDTVSGTHCQDVSFWVCNTGGSSKTISTMTVSWGSPTAYYGTITWGATTVFNNGGSPRGVDATTYTFTASQTLAAGASVKIKVGEFRQKNTAGGGPKVSMDLVPFTIGFSDGSVLTFTTDNSCGG
jgi:hypothetical protein